MNDQENLDIEFYREWKDILDGHGVNQDINDLLKKSEIKALMVQV